MLKVLSLQWPMKSKLEFKRVKHHRQLQVDQVKVVKQIKEEVERN